MTTISSLNDSQDILVIDACVLINVLGTGRPAEMLRALNREVIVEAIPYSEVHRDPISRHSSEDTLKSLLNAGLLQMTEIDETEEEIFFNLVGRPLGESIDDGEAASIAVAAHRSHAIVLDDKKGERVARAEFPNIDILCTMDLLNWLHADGCFDEAELREMVFSALKFSKARVPYLFREWVIGLIGNDRLQECTSLGRV